MPKGGRGGVIFNSKIYIADFPNNMWVIGKDENALISPHSSNVLAKSGKSVSKVVPEEEDDKT